MLLFFYVKHVKIKPLDLPISCLKISLIFTEIGIITKYSN